MMKTPGDFFLFCSGVDTQMLEKCPSDRNKYMGIGATVLFTGVFAFFSSGYALYTVFDAVIPALIFGAVWGLMIFNLDRYIVMSMKSYGQWYRDLIVALPRLALAVLLAVVISKPLELKIFEKEIRGETVQMEQELFKTQEDKVAERFENQVTDLQQKLKALKSDIAEKTALRDTLAKEAIREADGTGGSKKKNLGPIYLAKKADAEKAQVELEQTIALNQPLILEYQRKISQMDSTVLQEKHALEHSKYDGMAARLEALERLTAKSKAILWASIFITLLFIAIETAPILVKLISYRSPYDYLLHEHEHVFQMSNLEKTTLLSNAVKNRLKFDTETGLHRADARVTAEKAIIDQKLKDTLEQLGNGNNTDPIVI